MKGWIKEKFASFAKIVPGYAFNSSDFLETGIPVIKIGNVKNGQVDLSDPSTQYVDSAFFKTLDSKYQVEKGNILISLTGSHITQPNSVVGRIGRLRSEKIAFVNQRAAKFEPFLGVCDEGFLYYLLSTETLRQEIALLAHGAANQANVSHKDIEKIKIFFAPFPIQRKIAAVLSAYDDLIENNNRRIAILEKMAEELYREWFVRLRFPGHEKTKISKGIPGGWEIKRLGNIVNAIMGQSPPSEFYNQAGIGLPFNQGVGTYGQRYPQKIMFCKATGRIVDSGTILISVRAPVGRLNIADCKMIIGRGLAGLNHKMGLNSYLFYLLRDKFSTEDLIGNGSVFNSVTKDELLGLKILSPSKFLVEEFDKTVLPIDKSISIILKNNDCLKTSRDKLLSRLMSGKIDLENLDIQFPASMQEGE